MAGANTRDYRGKAECIFKYGGEVSGDFCQWNNEMILKNYGGEEDIADRVELCRLCQSQSLLRSVSFIGTIMKDFAKVAAKPSEE